MPSKTMDQRRLPSMNVPSVSSSFFSDEIRFPAQRQVGFWKSESLTDNQHVMRSVSGEAISSEPFGLPMGSWSAANYGLNLQSNGLGQQAMFVQPDSLNTNENKIELNEVHYESRLFSSSLPGILHKKHANGALFDQSVSIIDTNLDEENVTSESLKEIEAQAIGDLLPDDDDLFSGVIDAVKIEFAASTNNNDDVDDDLFYSGGGMELESNCIPNKKKADMNSLFGGDFIHSVHPSRTLFVNNIENLEDADLKVIFERYGDIHMLYTTCKPLGFVIVSYYDLRSACNAMRELQGKLVMNKKLDICFGTSKDNTLKKDNNQGMLLVSNLDSSVSNGHLNKIFGLYGEIKEIHDMPHKHQYKFIEFYDIRASEAALCGLNMSDIMGKRIQIELSHPGSARQLMQQDESNLYDIKGSTNSSPSLCYGGVPFGVVTSHSIDNGPLHGQHSLSQGSDSFPHYLSSPVNITSIGIHSNHPRIDDLNNSLGKLNFGLQCMPSFLSHSIPDQCDGIGNSNSYRSPNTTASSIALNFVGHADGVDMHIPGRQKSAGINQQSFANSEQAFSSHGNSQHLLHGHQYIWNSSTSSPYHRTPGMLMRPNSPSQLHGRPRETSNMMNNILPLRHHHVGSAPTGNPSWDRNHSYSGDLTDSSVFHPGSLGNIGFSGSPLHTLEFTSQNMFPQVGGNCIDNSISSSHVGLPSPQQKYRTLLGSRNPMIPMPTTFDSPTDRVRSRRNDVSSNQVESKKQYELDIERIIRGEDNRTTLMIKNIPNKYTSKMLLAAIDENHRGNYDFIYLPIDFKNKCNVGYAFINLIDPQQIITFYKAFNGKKWEKFNSEKVATLTYARIQGKAALIAHFQNSSLMNEDKRCRPILFRSDGPNAGDQEPFPTSMNIRSRSGRSRTQNNEDNYQGSGSSPPNSANVEEHSKDCNNSTTSVPKGNVSSQTHTAPV